MGKPIRVLMVEDSENDALLELHQLRKNGYEPEHERVETAGAMSNALREKAWDVILCDYQMPHFSGLAALALLKETGIDIPLIIVSGTIGEETAVEAMKAGACDYVMKGNLSRLAPAVVRELAEADSRRKRKQAEAALTESEWRYRLIADNTYDWEFWVDRHSQFLYVSPSCLRVTGHEAAEFMADPTLLDRIIHPEDRTIYAEHMSNEQSKPHLEEIIFRIIRPDGAERWIGHVCQLVTNKEGLFMGRRGSNRDISERKWAADSLRLSEENFRRSLDESPLGVRIVSAEGDSLYANRTLLAMFDYDSIEELQKISPKENYTPESYAEFLTRQEMRQRNDFVPSEYEISITRKDGEVRHLQVFRKEIIWNGSRQFQTLYNDITERKMNELALRESERRFMDVLYASDDAILLIGDNKFVDCNEATARMLKYASREEFLQVHPSELSPPEQPDGQSSIEKADEMMRLAFDRGYNRFEWMHRRANNEDFPVEVSLTPIVHEGKRLLYCVWRDITEYKKAAAEILASTERLRKALGATVQAMAVAVEMRDPYTAGHQRRVADMARSIATEMNLTADQIDSIRTVGIIHDLGKISVPAEILNKPSKLTSAEFNLIKTHAQSGYDILKDIEFPWPIARMVLEHHERMDGSGYPNALTGDSLLIESRILTVADVVESMSSHRPYRPALGVGAALEDITRNKGVHYDPEVVDACLRLFNEKGYKLAD
jgi:PAS domain S-box-containing protein